jgi:hypothetical protein
MCSSIEVGTGVSGFFRRLFYEPKIAQPSQPRQFFHDLRPHAEKILKSKNVAGN